MYGDRHDDTPSDYTADDAALLLDAGTNIINRVTTLIDTGRPIPPPPRR